MLPHPDGPPLDAARGARRGVGKQTMRKNPVIAAIGLIFLIALGLAGSLLLRIDTEPAPVPAAPRTAAKVLRFGHNIPEDSALHQASLRFAEEVRRKSGGSVIVEVYPAQQLGTDDQMMEMARQGTLDILLTPTAKISVSVPAMQYADLPFFFPTRDDLYEMLDGEPGQILLEKLREIDLVGVTFWENGFKHFTGNRPLHEPQDFAGTNIRIMKSRMLMEQFRAFGAHPIPIDFHATRQALADGVVDGQENPLIAIVSMGIHEVQPHLTLSSHGYLGYVFMISGKVFDALPPDVGHLLVETARELTPWEREETHRRERTLLETIRQAGVTVHELSEAERSRFAQATAHVAGLFEDVIGVDLLSRTQALLDAKYAAGRGERIVIGLDADLSMDGRSAGLAIKRGAQLAIDEINAAGGVLGKPLHLLARDHKAMPSQGIRNHQLFAAQPEVVAVLGGIHSAVAIPEIDSVHDAGMPFLIPWAAAAAVVENGRQPNFVFRISANDRLAAPFLLDQVVPRHRKPAILVENSVWGRGALDTMSQRLAQLGTSFAHVETFNRGETDFAPHLARVGQSGADALIMVANTYEGQAIVRAMAKSAAPLRIYSHWGITASDFGRVNQEALRKVELSFLHTANFLDGARPAARALVERYMARYGAATADEIVAAQGVAQAYDLVHLLAQAIRQAGSTDRRAVRDALEHLPPQDGVVKRYAPAFTPDHHDALGVEDYRMARYAEDGAIVRQDR